MKVSLSLSIKLMSLWMNSLQLFTPIVRGNEHGVFKRKIVDIGLNILE